MRATPTEIVEAMEGKLSVQDAWLLRESFEELTFYEEKLLRISREIDQYIEHHFKEMNEKLQSIPGVSKEVSDVVLGEIGPTVEAFKTSAHLASWASLAPGSYESAGKSKSSHITQGNKYLKTALVIAGGIAGKSHDEAFNNLYTRVSSKGSKMKAIIACAHKILRIIFKIETDQVFYETKRALGLRQQYKCQTN
ncbi:transposase [Staphylococcus americanisciuri]|uniref:Transposase n=1 Tax=Staphylococcus americanisciuri TaxID=2973940 RepID=A0ABT2F2K2_9STAP|nr:transposase [Staphylococcus americanisciuri]MCS4486651.1 transposase [Staphylococcus americanisciuri]